MSPITVTYPYRAPWSLYGDGIEPVGMTLVTAPTSEPLGLQQVKDWIRKTTDEEDQLIANLIPAAREQAEAATDLKLITQTWDVFYDQFPFSAGDRLCLPFAPIASVTSVSYLDGDGVTQTWSSALYAFVPAVLPPGPRRPAYLSPIYSGSYPSTRYFQRAVTVRVVAGYGATASSVPYSLQTGMAALIGTWAGPGRQTAIEGTIVSPVPDVLDRLFGAYRAY